MPFVHFVSKGTSSSVTRCTRTLKIDETPPFPCLCHLIIQAIPLTAQHLVSTPKRMSSTGRTLIKDPPVRLGLTLLLPLAQPQAPVHRDWQFWSEYSNLVDT